MPKIMTQKREAIIGVLCYCCQANNKLYCQISQKQTRVLMKQIYGEDISGRGLNYALESLEQQGFFERQATRRPLPPGGWRQNRTVYYLKRRAIDLIRWLTSKFGKVANWFRLKCPSSIYFKRREVSNSDYPKFPQKEERPPPFWSTETGIDAFNKAKAYFENL